jgi:lysophospholipase L1-like esterase
MIEKMPFRPLTILCTLLPLCGAPAAMAQATYPTFGQVDYYFTQNPQLFQNLWQAAATQTVRIAILGDSQETNPGGRGLDYIPRLNYQMWQVFGNVPETPLEGCSFYGSGAPYADWLLSGSCAAPGPSATRLAANQILPGMQPYAFSTLNGTVNVNGEDFGQLTLLQQDASGVDPAAAIPTNVSYFNTSGVVKAKIFAATNPSSGEVAYWAEPLNAQLPSYYAPVTTSGTLSLGLQSSTFAVTSGSTAALNYAGNKYMALQVAGTDDNLLTDIIGLRFFNETHPQGVVFDTFSAGGYQAANFLASSSNAGAVFAALNFQAVVLHYGANDSGDGISAQQFQTNIEAVMALVRSWVGDPNFPIILIADVYRTGLTAAQQAQFDMYVGAQLAIAQSDSNVLVINSRRLMDDLGWNAASGNSGTFLVDGIHYTPYGAAVLAAAEAAAMMGQVLVAGCAADANSVTLQSGETLLVDLGGTSPCSTYGQLSVAGSLTLLQPTLTINLTNGFTPALGQTFQILSAGSISGTFGTLSLPTLPAGLAWSTTLLYSSGIISVVSAAAAAPAATDGPLPGWALGLLAVLLWWIASQRMKSAS